jgi:hypothetical protein
VWNNLSEDIIGGEWVGVCLSGGHAGLERCRSESERVQVEDVSLR